MGEARADPAVFITTCLRDTDRAPIRLAGVHQVLQQFLTDHPRALVELPRDHGKSTQVCGRILWELGRNPGLRVKIICATDAIAAERSRFIRDAIDQNAFVRMVFPHLQPARPWSAEAFTVRRPADVIGPSVAAVGVGTGTTGTRADLLICDDVVDVRSLHSRAERERVNDYFTNNLMNLLEPDGRFWGLFTPWHRDDLNARLKRNNSYALLSCAVGEDLEPVWPERWPAERLQARREEIGSASFARGYHLRPVAEEDTLIRPAWVKFWSEPAACEQTVLAVDPAVSTATRADRSALVVMGRVAHLSTGGAGERSLHSLTPTLSPEAGERGSEGTRSLMVGAGSEIRVLAARAARLTAPELVALIDEFDRVWNPDLILFESNAAFLGMKELLVRQARFGCKLKGVTQTADKSARVATFSVTVENGAFRLKGNAAGDGPDESQRELYEEMVSFPFHDHDDLVDATATACAYLVERRGPLVW